MRSNKQRGLILFIIGVIVVLGIRFITPIYQDNFLKKTSDAEGDKKIVVALDSWVGYFYFRSPVFKKLMRDSGYMIEVIDDNADYETRMKKFKNGEYDFAVATVDSYILNGSKEKFPGTIISVIDESKGGDAIVGWESKVATIDVLNESEHIKIAYTPNSPSEHLLKSVGVHFGIEYLTKNDDWRIPTEGTVKALQALKKKEADVAVLWEPELTQALEILGVVKLLGTEDTEKLIVDILLVNRAFSEKNPLDVEIFLKNYYKTLKIYRDDRGLLEKDVKKYMKLKQSQIDITLKGVRWYNLNDNARWFGVDGENYQDEIISVIESTVDILIDNNDFNENPLPNNDPYMIVNSKYVSDLYNNGILLDDNQSVNVKNRFSKLTDDEWDELRTVGTLKIRPITFQSGTYEINNSGNIELEKIIKDIKHYPNFRILIEGHTGTRGDEDENKKLSFKRAQSVKEYLINTFGIEENRIRAVGRGGLEPLKRKEGESSRSYNYRLMRVEMHLLTEDF
ncbi:MAG: OmpA family protein [Halanaerobiales bacterium]|nr:OmpA family protein [Halanaerobiales bacterium]